MIRIWLIAAGMGLAVLAAHSLAPDRLIAGADTFALADMIPETFGDWRPDPSVRPVLPREAEEGERPSLADRIYDQTLVRTYRNGQDEQVMLVIAYGRNQSDALQLHLPDVCYASQGFTVGKAGRTRIDLGADGTLPVLRLQTQRGPRHEPVTYWTRIGDSVAPSMLGRQWAKLTYGIRGRVPDGVLVRVSTISTRSGRAFALQERFLREMILAVDPAQRRFLIGAQAERFPRSAAIGSHAEEL